jgi:uncharacterized phage protein gp47/JayE
MTTFPLPTLACTITANGITSPSFADILTSLQASFQSIHGTDSYIDPDSEDGQMLGILARAQYDSNQATIAAYNNYSPATSQGVGLSTMVKVNGIVRNNPSFSAVNITIGGTAGTTIPAGIVGDNQNLGTEWLLPPNVVIPNTGVITVTATCSVVGAIQAEADTLTKIKNPTAGWQTANNATPASPGAPVEPDAALRVRQSYSTALPAITPNESLTGAIANVAGVTRVKVYENDTGSADVNGLPAHSMSAVVEGGDISVIASAIQLKKTIGAQTFGTTAVATRDASGNSNIINFNVLSYVNIFIEVGIHALVGYTSSTGQAIINSIVEYIAEMDIGQSVYVSRLYAPANLSGTAALRAVSALLGTTQSQSDLDALSATYEITSLRIGTVPFTAQSISSIAIGGANYVVGNTITLTGGTTTDPAVITVDAIGTAGVITAAHISHPGSYTALPVQPMAQGSTNGSGTGATFNVEFFGTGDMIIAYSAVAKTVAANVSLEFS